MSGRLRIRPRGLWVAVLERLRGRDQLLIQAGDALPLVVASYPRGRTWFATSLQSALCSTFRSVPAAVREQYRDVLENVPSLVVAELRARNAGSCLGHHHPPGTESRLARRLMVDTGRRVGEIDLAVEEIRAWEPRPLSGLAAVAAESMQDDRARADFAYQRFHTALLAVFLHELEHLAFPARPEHEVRRRSDAFYLSALGAFVEQEYGVTFGI